MKMYMIARICDSKGTVTGFRILDADENKMIDVSEANAINVLKQGHKIENIEFDGSQIVGSNGSLDRYIKIYNNKAFNKSLITPVIINRIGDKGFTVANPFGGTARVTEEDLINYLDKGACIPNGKIIEKNGTKYISSINGNYENIELNSIKESNQNSNKDDIKESNEKLNTNKNLIENTEIELDFSDEQKTVLKYYYKLFNISKSTANNEILHLNDLVKKNKQEKEKFEERKDSKLLEFIAKLRTPDRIACAFGKQLCTVIIMFLQYDLPLPYTLIVLCQKYALKDLNKFYKCVFPEYEDVIDIALQSTNDTLRLASKLYMEYIINYSIIKKYSLYDTEDSLYDMRFIQKYICATRFDITELCAILSILDIFESIKKFLMSHIPPKILDKYLKYLGVASVIAFDELYYKSSYSYEEERLLKIAIASYREFMQSSDIFIYTIDSQYLKRNMEDTLHIRYSECKYVSSTFNFERYGYELTPYDRYDILRKNGLTNINRIDNLTMTLADMIECVLKNKTEHEVSVNNNIHKIYSEYRNTEKKHHENTHTDTDEFCDNSIENTNAYDTLKGKQKFKEGVSRLKTDIENSGIGNRTDDSINSNFNTKSNTLDDSNNDGNSSNDKSIESQILIDLKDSVENLNKYDYVDVYSELLKYLRSKNKDLKEFDEKVSSNIAKNMVKNGLTYNKMSEKQKYMLKRAIEDLLSIYLGTDINIVNSNRYSLDTHLEYKEMVKKAFKILEDPKKCMDKGMDRKEIEKIERICNFVIFKNYITDKQLYTVTQFISNMSI